MQVPGTHRLVPHPFGPPPPHVSPAGQPPQEIVRPHPSKTVPHVAPSAAQVVGRQPHLLGAPPPPHTAGRVHAPQLSIPPQPSDTAPQSAPNEAHVAPREHPGGGGCWQMPQLTTASQPSEKEPQVAPSAAHVFGVHGAVPH